MSSTNLCVNTHIYKSQVTCIFIAMITYIILALQHRAEIIATYALCGFANVSSVGVQLGGLGPMAPHRKGDLAAVVMRSLLGGVIACLMTASIAGNTQSIICTPL